MEFVIEILGELLLEIAFNKKVSPLIRYPLLAIFSTLYGGIILLFLIVAVNRMQEEPVVSVLLLGVVAILLWLAKRIIQKYRSSETGK